MREFEKLIKIGNLKNFKNYKFSTDLKTLKIISLPARTLL